MDAKDIREKLASATYEAERLRKQLDAAERACQHSWNKTQYTPIEHKAYTIPADPPGTMGVDWRPECHVPSSTEKMWSRVCSKCGKTETTKATKKENVYVGDGVNASADVPHFFDRNW